MYKQKKLKDKIEEQKENFENIYLKSHDSILLVKNDKYIDCNEAFLKMMKLDSKKELIDQPTLVFTPQYQPNGELATEKLKNSIELTLKNGYNRSEWYITDKENNSFWTEIVSTHIKQKDGTVFHLLIRDIEDRKKVEKQRKLLENQTNVASIGRLITMIAHQWRQPMSQINGITSSIYNDILNNKIDHKKLEQEIFKIEDITASLSQGISKIHNFYSIDTKNKGQYLTEIIDECTEILFPEFAKSLRPDILVEDKDKLKVNGYATGLQQVIITILTNSIEILSKRNIKGPKIFINLYKDNNHNIIEIEDNGGGINKNHINKVFDMAFSTNKDEFVIRGFGLSIAKDIIENNLNGSIIVKNGTLGAKFTIRYK
jgi:PAS domain S-box-containing protein